MKVSHSAMGKEDYTARESIEIPLPKTRHHHDSITQYNASVAGYHESIT
jgi:hypothetical protein